MERDSDYIYDSITQLADAGITLVDISAGRKFPTSKGWQNTQYKPSSDLSWQMLAYQSDDNVGMLGGRLHGGYDGDYLTIVDIDRHGESDGVQTFANVCSELGLHRADTLTASSITAHDGVHLLYRTGTPMRNHTGVWPGVDIKCVNGQCVAPGSRLADGHTYRWAHGRTIRDVGISLMPKALYEAIVARQSGDRQDTTCSGNRTKLAQDIVQLTDDNALIVFAQAYNLACALGLDGSEARCWVQYAACRACDGMRLSDVWVASLPMVASRGYGMQIPSHIPQGTRNDTLYAVMASYRYHGVPMAVAACLAEWLCDYHMDTPLSTTEIIGVVSSAYRR